MSFTQARAGRQAEHGDQGCVVAVTTGGRTFALRIIPGLILVILAAWLGWALRF